jgi:general stress protein 26
MEIKHFSEIEDEFIERVHSMVWCNVATVDSRQRPRSRILHPIWEGSTGWIGTNRNSYKSKDLAHNPYVSLAYIADLAKPVYADCTAEWVDDLEQKVRIWNLFKDAPPPLGYDPAPIFTSPDHEDFGLLKLTPWRIAIVTFPAPSHEEGQRIWRRREES